MTSRRKRISLFPEDQRFRAERKKLPVFKPLDLRSLVGEGAKSGDSKLAVMHAFRRRNEMQLQELLHCLGLDRSQPDAWQKGFFFLAYYNYGVGHIAWYPRRTNRNAARWTVDHDFDLLREVVKLTNDGLSERRAIKRLAFDRKKQQLFPYREQQHRHFAKGTEQKRREEALWARLQKLKASANARSILNLIVGDRDDRLSFYERTVRDLDASNARSELVKNQQHRRNSGS
jgi:hypothetical protein